MHFYQQKNIEFYDFLNENFKINKAHRWADISQQITKAKISATYKFFSKLFPLKNDYAENLKSESSLFKSIHYNKLKPNKIIHEVVRYSLYSDEIIVFHPLQNPSITNQKISPIKNPQYWLQNFIDSLYFYVVLQKWVRSGIVKLIVNPYEYNFELREKFDNEAKKRVNSFLSEKEYHKISMDEASDSMAEMLAQSYKGKSIDKIKQGLINMKNPRFDEKEAEDFAQLIYSKIKSCNPLYDKLNVPYNQSSIFTERGGGNLESILYVAELVKGNIYTTDKTNWFQINHSIKADYWTKVAHLYSKIEMPFLNDVDTSFALHLREEDRLSGVRLELRKIYSAVNSMSAEELEGQKLLELNDGFIDALKKADAEWNFIKKDAQNKRMYWAASTVGLPIIFNDVSILPLILGSSFWLGANIREERLKTTKFKLTNPLSVYVDLKNKEPNFFSELRNCIL
jgi:hypothetical protein